MIGATTLLLSAFSPALVALVRRQTWPKELVVLVSLLIVAAIYVLGQFFDGLLAWPLSGDFWLGLAAAWGVQQTAYWSVKVAPLLLDVAEQAGNEISQ